ncbi:MAG: alpha/beta hydrolase [Candidatus Micrarchaeota archaeon]|nr:alpha/beta hydrolase [Candidatus Micrarchaeota archaeon]MDE1864984.1 alpha/beta hydrolase [Candidatus Micrarchaeota archaeon]
MDYDKDFEEGYTASSLGNIHYMRHRSEGKKLIFLHGLGGTTKAWARLMRFMPEDLDISLLDMLGHGKSAAPEDINYTISEQVQVLQEFVSDQNNGSSCIVGHSYGGWVAAYYASYPYPSSSFVLEDCAGLAGNLRPDLDEQGREEKMERLVQTLLMLGNKEYVMRSIIDASLKEQLTVEVLSRIKKPTLIVWGSRDDTVNPEYASIFNREIKGSRVEIVEGASHEPHYTNAQEFAQKIIGFIGEN